MCDIASNLASNYANTYETIVFTVCEYQNNTLINIIAFVYAIIFGRVGAHHLQCEYIKSDILFENLTENLTENH